MPPLIANGVAVILGYDVRGGALDPDAAVRRRPALAARQRDRNVRRRERRHAATAAALGIRAGLAESSAKLGGMAATMGGYQRRMDEWNLQCQLASAELTQICSQITAAQDRLCIAQKELDIQNAQIANAQAVSDFLTSKYTNAQLYSWMITQLTTVYTQAYQLAFSSRAPGAERLPVRARQPGHLHPVRLLGQPAQRAHRRGKPAVRPAAHGRAVHRREQPRTRADEAYFPRPHLPTALVCLRETGTCQIALDEVLFEYDHPGQYFRRLRSVAVTIPCVTGPYTGVNATLTLSSAMVRTQAPGTSYQPQSATAAPNDPTVVSPRSPRRERKPSPPAAGKQTAGLFDVNLHDERWLPFEGQGAISTWNLVLDPRDNNFDFTTITDVVLHLRYTARGGGDQTAAGNVRAQLKPSNPRTILVSVRNTFPDSLYAFFNPGTAGTGQTLTLPLTTNVFPYTNLGHGTAEIQNLALYLALSVPAAGNTIPAGFTGSANPISLAPMPGQTTAGEPIDALTASVAFSPGLVTPQTLSLTIPSANVPAALSTTVNGQTVLDPAKVEDVLLVITYSIG